jgi:hypothetical protein
MVVQHTIIGHLRLRVFQSFRPKKAKTKNRPKKNNPPFVCLESLYTFCGVSLCSIFFFFFSFCLSVCLCLSVSLMMSSVRRSQRRPIRPRRRCHGIAALTGSHTETVSVTGVFLLVLCCFGDFTTAYTRIQQGVRHHRYSMLAANLRSTLDMLNTLQAQRRHFKSFDAFSHTLSGLSGLDSPSSSSSSSSSSLLELLSVSSLEDVHRHPLSALRADQLTPLLAHVDEMLLETSSRTFQNVRDDLSLDLLSVPNHNALWYGDESVPEFGRVVVSASSSFLQVPPNAEDRPDTPMKCDAHTYPHTEAEKSLMHELGVPTLDDLHVYEYRGGSAYFRRNYASQSWEASTDASTDAASKTSSSPSSSSSWVDVSKFTHPDPQVQDIANRLARLNPRPIAPLHLQRYLECPDVNGVYTFHANPTAAPLYFKYDGQVHSWSWSGDKLNWMPTATDVMSGGKFHGMRPVAENRNAIAMLEIYTTMGEALDARRWSIRGAASSLYNAGASAVNSVRNTASKVASTVSNAASTVVNHVSNAASSAWDRMSAGAEAVYGHVSDTAISAVEWGSQKLHSLKELKDKAVEAAANMSKVKWSQIKQHVSELFDKVNPADLAHASKSAATTTTGATPPPSLLQLKATVNRMSDTFPGEASITNPLLKVLWAIIYGFVNGLVLGMLDNIAAAINACPDIGSKLGNIWSALGSALKEGLGALLSLVTVNLKTVVAAFKRAGDAFVKVYRTIKDFVMSCPALSTTFLVLLIAVGVGIALGVGLISTGWGAVVQVVLAIVGLVMAIPFLITETKLLASSISGAIAGDPTQRLTHVANSIKAVTGIAGAVISAVLMVKTIKTNAGTAATTVSNSRMGQALGLSAKEASQGASSVGQVGPGLVNKQAAQANAAKAPAPAPVKQTGPGAVAPPKAPKTPHGKTGAAASEVKPTQPGAKPAQPNGKPAASGTRTGEAKPAQPKPKSAAAASPKPGSLKAIIAEGKNTFKRDAVDAPSLQRLGQYPSPQCGQSLLKLKPMTGRRITDIVADLKANGFREIPPAPNSSRFPPDMRIFLNKDGGLVKIKPNGDGAQFTKFGRAGPMASKEVIINPALTGDDLTAFANTAFKVNGAGAPIPKLPGMVKIPKSAVGNEKATEAVLKAWADQGHVRTATPPGFKQLEFKP